MKTWLTLIRKDARILRVPLILLAMLAILPYVAILYLAALQFPMWDHRNFLNELTGSIFGIAARNHLLLVIAAGPLGAMAFAPERREGSIEFLSCLPVSRRRVILSKLIVSLGALAAAVLIQVVAMCLSVMPQWTFPVFEQEQMSVGAAMSSLLMAFAAGWILSTFMRSAAIAGSVAIFAAWIFGLVVDRVAQRMIFIFTPTTQGKLLITDVYFHAATLTYLAVACALAAAIAIGAVLYARRVAP